MRWYNGWSVRLVIVGILGSISSSS